MQKNKTKLNKQYMMKFLCKLSLLFLPFSGLISCKKASVVESPVPVLMVSTAYPQMEQVKQIIEANGLIEAWQETIISSQISGLTISNVYVNTGDNVKKGQVLARLSSEQVNSEILNQKAAVDEALANLEQAKAEAGQGKSLAVVGAISNQELFQYETKLKTAVAKVNAAKATLEIQKLKLNYTVITAPDDGRISARTATSGSVIQTGGEMFRIIKGHKLQWAAEVSLQDMEQLKPGQLALIQLVNKSEIQGVVREVSPVLSANTKNVVVYVDLPLNSSLKIGENVLGRIYAGDSKSFVIPFKAIVNNDGYNYVMVVSQEKRVHKTKVTLGNIYESMVEVSHGLQINNLVVTEGASFLDESDFVSIAKGH